MKPDLSQVYTELDLPPNCTLEEFRSAYLRRIAELHPDRTGRAPATAEARATLQQLVSTYTAVTGFHRRYGRMPGAAPPGGMRTTTFNALPGQPGSYAGDAARGGMRTVTFAALPPQSGESMPPPGMDEAPPSRPTWKLVALFLALLLILASWDWLLME